MTKKHFIALAKILHRYNTCDTTERSPIAKQGIMELTMELTELLASFNPLFDKEKFYKACGVVSFDESNK
jgi:hypothetical protein